VAELQIIDAEEYPQVRALIDVSVRKANLPDDIIESAVYGGVAESWALASAGDISLWPEAALAELKLAVCYRLAGMLLPALPNLTQEQKGERAGYQRTPINVERRQADLYGAAAEHLGLAIEIATDIVAEEIDVPVFIRAPGRRRW